MRNTFAERHCYLIGLDQSVDAEVSKALYVSPFFPADGHYRMRFTLGARELTATVTLYRASTAKGPASRPWRQSWLGTGCESRLRWQRRSSVPG